MGREKLQSDGDVGLSWKIKAKLCIAHLGPLPGPLAKYRATKAPMREVKRYVSPLVLKW